MPSTEANTPATVRSSVRAVREQASVRPGELARRAGITRQALHAIETGAYAPSTAIALRLARELGCRVEDLFSLPDETLRAQLVTTDDGTPSRVRLAYVGEQLIALPLTGAQALGTPADGVTVGERAGSSVAVRSLTEPDAPRRTAIIAGCDPSLGLLGPHAARLAPGTRVLWRDQPSLDALRAVARGEAHAAGIHLLDPNSGEHNRPYVLRELTDRPAHLITLWDWEQGLIVAPGNPLRLLSPADLTRPGVRLANRGEGAGSRLLLDAWLEQAGLNAADRTALPGYGTCHATHLALAAGVARGDADAGPGPRAAATALGLDFVPLQRERFDLVVPDEHLDHPAVQALLAAATHRDFHAELAALGGYDPSHAGAVWRTT